MLIAKVISRALISIPEAIPARLPGTEPVVVLVTGVFVRPRPMPANSDPGSIVSQLGYCALLPNFMKIKPRPIIKRPEGIIMRG